mgnify:FL=1|jgi:hypothetical protein|nr:MAG TPA: hypothetical protein [Bacteriophage sp.]
MKKKELVEAVSDCSISVKNLEEKLNDVLLKYAQMSKNYSELLEYIKNTDGIIKSLITQNFVDNPSYAAVVLIPYRGKPTFVKDGKVVAEDASEVTMTWDAYEHSVRFSTENI